LPKPFSSEVLLKRVGELLGETAGWTTADTSGAPAQTGSF
jgi:hypothetical protein